MKLKSILFLASVAIVAVIHAFPSAENQPNTQAWVGESAGSHNSPKNSEDKKRPKKPASKYPTKKAIEAKQEMEILKSLSRVHSRTAPEAKNKRQDLTSFPFSLFNRKAPASGSKENEDAKTVASGSEKKDAKTAGSGSEEKEVITTGNEKKAEGTNPFENMDPKDVEEMVRYFPQIRSFIDAIHEKQEVKK